MIKPRIIIDIETTGLSPKRDKMVSIAAVVSRPAAIDGSVSDQSDSLTQGSTEDTAMFSSFINPGMHIPEKSSEIHGVTDDMVNDCGDWSVVGPKFWRWAFKYGGNPCVFVGHNIHRFDMPFILRETSTIREFLPKYQGEVHVMDTLPISRTLFPHSVLASKKQSEIHKHLFGTEPEGQHSAAGDVIALKRIFEHEKYQLQALSPKWVCATYSFNP